MALVLFSCALCSFLVARLALFVVAVDRSLFVVV